MRLGCWACPWEPRKADIVKADGLSSHVPMRLNVRAALLEEGHGKELVVTFLSARIKGLNEVIAKCCCITQPSRPTVDS